MFLIRSIANANSGRRDEAVALLKSFSAETQKELGRPESRVMTGCIGPNDSEVVTETVVASLADFEQGIDKVNKWPGMQKYGPKFGELFVSGSHRFEVYRLQ